MAIRQSNRPDRRIVSPDQITDEQISRWILHARYEGSGHHKQFPANYGFVRTGRRANKSVCDFLRVIPLEEAHELLLAGIRKRMLSRPEMPNAFPKYVWSVSENREVFEAKTSENTPGIYHGYPLERKEDMYHLVLKRWDRP